MSSQLAVSVGQYTDKGRKKVNQDFYGLMVPNEPSLSSKGVAMALADGISSSEVSQVASEMSIRSLVEDYYCTSETWSVKKSVTHVLKAANSWLHSQTYKSGYRFDKDKGYVCTLSAMVIKSSTAYLFHLGDCRIYRLIDGEGDNAQLEQLTDDHRLRVSDTQSYLSRAMGFHPEFECDHKSFPVNKNDVFIFLTDGIYEYCNDDSIIEIIRHHKDDLNTAAQAISQHAFEAGSDDNLSVQILKVDALPQQNVDERLQELTDLPFPPVLDVRMNFDGYKIIDKLHSSSRSHVYLALDLEQKAHSFPVVIKTPSVDLKDDPAYLERFLMEEWIAKRINNANVLKPCEQERKRHFLYTVFEHIDGQTLTQWMVDNPKPSMHTVRQIVGQIVKGATAFHRLEMVHQDLRPENIMIDKSGVLRIIDFGSTKVAGLLEMTQVIEHQNLLGTAQYSAPEYFLGETGDSRSDLFSIAVIKYQMLTGKLPYGAQVAKARTKTAQHKLRYQTALHDDLEIPAWVDHTLEKALHPNPLKRYQELSEFMFDLSKPSQAFLNKRKDPLLKRNPVAFWQSVCIILVGVIMYLLAQT